MCRRSWAEPVRHGDRRGVRSIDGLKFLEDVAHGVADLAERHMERERNTFVRRALDDEPQDVHLFGRQRGLRGTTSNSRAGVASTGTPATSRTPGEERTAIRLSLR